MSLFLRKKDVDCLDYDFEEEVCFETNKDNVVICGNWRYKSFGDETLLNIISYDYYDDELGYDYNIFEELEKVTGKKWCSSEIRGYCQSDWNTIYYVEEEVSEERIKELEAYYFGKVDCCDCYYEKDGEMDYSVYIPHYILWEGEKTIAKFLGEKDVKLLEDE